MYSRVGLRLALAAVAAAFGIAAAPAGAATSLPDGFQEVTLVSGFSVPNGGIVDVTWAPDGRMFIADRTGEVFVHNPGDPPDQNQLVLDIRDHVNSSGDRGLLGITPDRDFASNGFLYLLYSWDNNTADDTDRKVSTLTRVVVHPDNSVDGGATTPTETTILGSVHTIGATDAGSCGPPDNSVDCIPSEGISHSIGTVRSAPDGTLFLGTGDGSDYTIIDPLSLNDDNPATFRGKIMHVARDGRGLPGHPFCPGDNNLDDVCTKIYADALRNPFRFTLLPDGSGLAIGDVGQSAWEEIDFSHGGENFGWPCREGFEATPFKGPGDTMYGDYQQCKDVNANNTTTPPALVAAHDYESGVPCDSKAPTGNTIVGGPVYEGDQYPAGYRGQVFFGDVGGLPSLHEGCGWMGRADVSGNTLTNYESFATDWPAGVDLESAPDGNLVYVSLSDNAVRELVYGPGNHAPALSPSATPASGVAPLGVTFHAGGSDPDSDPVTYDWDLGDGSAHLTGDTPGHFYDKPGHYVATVTADDGRGMTATASVPVTVTAPGTPAKPRLRVTRLRLSGNLAALAGRGLVHGSFSSTNSVKALNVSLWRGRPFATRCSWWSARSGRLRHGACRQQHWLHPRLHRKAQSYTWTLKLGAPLPTGSYTVMLQALPRSSTLAPSTPARKHLRVR
jgi:glucose/arabinose dehydrogenase